MSEKVEPYCIPCLTSQEHVWHDQGEFNDDEHIQPPPRHMSEEVQPAIEVVDSTTLRVGEGIIKYHPELDLYLPETKDS